MDHVRAQQLISDALDKLAVDRFELVEAKNHSRECPECAAYVRALIAVQRTPLPEPPADLADRVMALVRAEAQQKAVARARALAAPRSRRTEHTSEKPEQAPARTYRDLWRRAIDPRNRRQVAIWGSVAATVFVFAAWGALLGVREILIPPRVTEMTIVGNDTAETYQDSVPGGPPVAGSANSLQASAPPANMIELSGTIYRLRSQNANVSTSELDKIGRTRIAFEGQRRAESYDVLGGPDTSKAYVVTDLGTYEFQSVTRQFEGQTYVLLGGPVSQYGEWPQLPSTLSQPASEDGSPTFKQYGADPAGTPVYVLRNGSPADGIAIAPNPPPGDPVVGSPNWTWWALLK